MKIAVDSSVLVALLDPLDIWRSKAVDLHNALLAATITPIYFDCFDPDFDRVAWLKRAAVPSDVSTGS
jgi:hypothetical protein